MFLSWIFKKYKEREYRILLIKDLIDWLEIDQKQKDLYLESLDVLDDEWLERFFNKLTSVIEIIEENSNNKNFTEKTSQIYEINKQEELEKTQELNAFNLILDNI